MTKVLVLAEGVTERGAVSAIATKLKAQIRTALMNGNRPEKLRGFISTTRYDKYIVLKDLKPHGERNIRTKYNIVRRNLDAHLRARVGLSIVKQATEAWFLADLEALERTFNCKIERTIENPEDVQDPEEELDNLLKRCGKRYLKGEQIARRIMEELNLEKASTKCISLRTFLDSIRDP